MPRYNIGECQKCGATYLTPLSYTTDWVEYDKFVLCCPSPDIQNVSDNDSDDEIELNDNDDIIEEVHVDRFETIISGKDPKKPKNWSRDKPQDHYIW